MATKKKSRAQLDREIAEWQAARSGLSKHHEYLLSRRTRGGGLRAGYLTPAGWHGDPMTIEDRKLRLEALREQPAPRFPKEPRHSTKKESLAKDYRVLVRVQGAPKPVHISSWMTHAQAEHAAKNHRAMIRDRGWTQVVEIEDASGSVTRLPR